MNTIKTRRLQTPSRKSEVAHLKASSPCSGCGKKMDLTLDKNGVIKGGYYFGNMPLYRKSEKKKAMDSGTRKSKIGSVEFNVLKYDPKPYAFAEFWECPACYKKTLIAIRHPGKKQYVDSKKPR